MYPRLSYHKPSYLFLPIFVIFMSVCTAQSDNETAVWIASKEGKLEVVKALVAAGADLSIASVSTMLVTVSIHTIHFTIADEVMVWFVTLS